MQNARAMSRKCPRMSALVFEGDPKCSRHVWSQKSLKNRKKSGKYATFRGLGESRPNLSAFLIALAEVITSARRWISTIFERKTSRVCAERTRNVPQVPRDVCPGVWGRSEAFPACLEPEIAGIWSSLVGFGQL